jgi:hypothetical protein
VTRNHFVYLYRKANGGEIVYVGYGGLPQRSMAHPGIGHNPPFVSWLAKNRFQLEVAGPYGSASEAKRLEAALISAIGPRFNRTGSDGPIFSPVGVPPELWRRPRLLPLTIPQVGRKVGGALIVYLSPGDRLNDGRKKFDVAAPEDEDAVSNIEQAWAIGPLLRIWEERSDLKPKAVVGVTGPKDYRVVVGCLAIQGNMLGDPNFKSASRGRWKIPLKDRSNPDYMSLRGRRVDGATFGRFSHDLHIWVDRNGRTRYPRVAADKP